VNWTTEIQPVPVPEVYDAINAHAPEGLMGADAQIAAAKAGAKELIAELEIPDGLLVGVELAGETGPNPLPVVTIRVRQVEAPPETEDKPPEVALGERASGTVKGGVESPAIA
jgi:hypothetical protein